jgi:integrase
VLWVLSAMSGTPRLMAQRLYGAGLRVMECMTLRVKDFDFDRGPIVVRSGKGNKDRVTLLPKFCREALQGRLLRGSELHTRDPPGRCWLRTDARRPVSEIPFGRALPRLAIRLPFRRPAALVGATGDGTLARFALDRSEGFQEGVGEFRNPQGGRRPRAAPFLRLASICQRHRHPSHPIAAWTP